MSIEAQLLQSIDHVFSHHLQVPAAEAFARSGSSLTRLCVSRKSLAYDFFPSFVQDEAGPPELQVGFLTSAEVDLSKILPDPPTEHRVVSRDDCFALWEPGEFPILYLLDRRTNRALIWLAANAAPDWMMSRPTLPIMYAHSVNSPWIALHAAAVGRGDRILLLAGEGRVGKTTAALACARAGWTYAGDDYVYANTLSGRVEPLYCSARLRADMAPAFPDLVTSSTNVSHTDGEVRYELKLTQEAFPGQFHGGSLAAILLPRRRGSALPTFSPARRLDAVSALYTSLLLTQLGWRDVMINKVATTVGLAPVFFVDTGQDPRAIPDAFAEFLDGLK
jgi:hypothetical protein